MGKKLYVGNLSFATTEADLRDAFAGTGHEVSDVKVILDRDSGQSRGFGFVEMTTDAGCQAAIAALNGKEVKGRAIVVNEARERTGGGGGRDGERGNVGGGRSNRW